MYRSNKYGVEIINEVLNSYNTGLEASEISFNLNIPWSTVYYIRTKGFKSCTLLYNYLYKDATIWLERKRSKIEGILGITK